MPKESADSLGDITSFIKPASTDGGSARVRAHVIAIQNMNCQLARNLIALSVGRKLQTQEN